MAELTDAKLGALVRRLPETLTAISNRPDGPMDWVCLTYSEETSDWHVTGGWLDTPVLATRLCELPEEALREAEEGRWLN